MRKNMLENPRLFFLKKVGRDWHHYDKRPPKPYSVFYSEKQMIEFLNRNGMVKASAVDNLAYDLQKEYENTRTVSK